MSLPESNASNIKAYDFDKYDRSLVRVCMANRQVTVFELVAIPCAFGCWLSSRAQCLGEMYDFSLAPLELEWSDTSLYFVAVT